MWNIDFRPPFLQTIKGCADHTIEAVMGFKVQYDKEAERRNLGEDIFQRDGVTRKIRFKAQSDNGTTKLHLARYLRLPLVHPKDYYKNMPSRRDVVVRNFPMDHYGLTGQIKDDVIGKVHNRTVVTTFDAYGKSSTKPGKTGKFADKHQLEEGLLNYACVNHAIWPMDYSVFPIWRTLVDAKWGATAVADEKKRSELVIEFINSSLAENCAKAVHQQYPVVFEQVTVIRLYGHQQILNRRHSMPITSLRIFTSLHVSGCRTGY
jgi:hypothetical protein